MQGENLGEQEVLPCWDFTGREGERPQSFHSTQFLQLQPSNSYPSEDWSSDPLLHKKRRAHCLPVPCSLATLAVPWGWGGDSLSQHHGQEPRGISKTAWFTVLWVMETHLSPPPILCPAWVQPTSWHQAREHRAFWLLRSANMVWSSFRSGIFECVGLQHLHTSPISIVIGQWTLCSTDNHSSTP